MAQLVDDLLEISRVTRGKVRLQKEVVDVATIVAYAVETSRPVIDAHRHRLSIALPAGQIKVDADAVRMAQVLSNLLNNAAKYTADGGHIRLSIAEEADHVVFRVRDNGIGIPPGDALSRLRPVRPGRSLAGPIAGRPGPGTDARAQPGRDARRNASRPPARAWTREASSWSACRSGNPATSESLRAIDRPAQPRPDLARQRSTTLRLGHAGCSWWTTT